jgi:AcrR family transcriptional regulator
MKNQKLSKRVSKADWLEKALEILETEGIDYVKIERLSKELNVSRSGFYWHFENRQALINEMIKYWGNEFTSVVTSNKKLLTLYPKERLYRTIKIIIENNLTQLELPMRACAETDPVAKKLVNQVYQMRLEFIRSTLTEMGFEGEDLEMRTHLFVCYHTWEGNMFMNLSKAKRLRWLKLRLELICTPSAISN